MNKRTLLFPVSRWLSVGMLVALLSWTAGCGTEDSKKPTGPDKGKAVTQNKMAIDAEVEISCGECNFEMEGDGCTLAVRIDGKGYYVAGSSIDDHGDAHAEDGLCNCIKKAKVVGTLENGKFKPTSITLLDVVKK